MIINKTDLFYNNLQKKKGKKISKTLDNLILFLKTRMFFALKTIKIKNKKENVVS